jgi:hypothetical protein
MASFNFRFSVQSVRPGSVFGFSTNLKGLDGRRMFSDVTFVSDVSDPVSFVEKFAGYFYSLYPFVKIYLFGNEMIVSVDDHLSVDNVCGGDEIPVDLSSDGLVVYTVADRYWTCETVDCASCCPEFECYGCGEALVYFYTSYIYIESSWLLGCQDCFPYDAGKWVCPVVSGIVEEIEETYLKTGSLTIDATRYAFLEGWKAKVNDFIFFEIEGKNKVLVLEFQRTELGGGSHVCLLAYVEPVYAYSESYSKNHLKFKAWYVKNNYPTPALYPTVQYLFNQVYVSPPPNSVEFDWNYCVDESDCNFSVFSDLKIEGKIEKNYCCKNSDIYVAVKDETEKIKIENYEFSVSIKKDLCKFSKTHFLVEIEACGKTYFYTVPIVRPGYLSQIEIEKYLLQKASEYYESARDCDSCCPEVQLLDPVLGYSDKLLGTPSPLPFDLTTQDFECFASSVQAKFVNLRPLSSEEKYVLSLYEFDDDGNEILTQEIESPESEVDFYLDPKKPYKIYVSYYEFETLLEQYSKFIYYAKNIRLEFCEKSEIHHETCKGYNDGKVKFPFLENTEYRLYRQLADETFEQIGNSNEQSNLSPGIYRMRASSVGYCDTDCIFEIRSAKVPVVTVTDVQPQCDSGAKKVEIKITQADLSCKECFEGVEISIDDGEYVKLDSTNVYVTTLCLGFHFVKIKDCSCCIHIHKFNVKEKIITN